MARTEAREKQSVDFATIVGGLFVIPSTADDPKAKKRVVEKDGTQIIKYDLQYEALSGRIISLEFDKGNYGERLKVTLQDGDEKTQIQLPVKSDYFVDFAKRLPSVDFSKDVKLAPFSIDKEPNKEGKVYTDNYLVIYQDEDKITNYYRKDGEDINGFPTYEGDWELYTVQRRSFLKKEVQALDVGSIASSPTAESSPKEEQSSTVTASTDNDEPDDLPF